MEKDKLTTNKSMIKSIFILMTMIFVTSCNERNSTRNEKSEEWVVVDNEEKTSAYKKIMEEKDFSFKRNGRCDDALEDTLHKRNEVYIENQMISDSLITVDFKFKDACCQKFLGDYKILNNKMIFEFEQVNS